jgi:hypothetical protein
MPSRIIVVHADKDFTDELATRLMQDGHEVVVVDSPEGHVTAPRSADVLELTVTRASALFPGVRIRVTGLPAGGAYAGFLGQSLADRVSVQNLMDALARFGI